MPDLCRLFVLVCCCEAKQYSENNCIFLRFQTEEPVLRVKNSNIACENTFNGDHFEIEGNHDSINDEEICFGFFCRFVTSAVTFRPRNKYFYVFGTLFDFCNFEVFFSGFRGRECYQSLLH